MQDIYFRTNSFRPNDRILKKLILPYVLLFALFRICDLWFASDLIERNLSLSGLNFIQGKVWTLVTYSFLHGNFFHLFFNALALYFVGQFLLLHELNEKRFLLIYFSGVLLGGFFWLLLHLRTPFVLVGASAGIASILMYFCHAYPEKSLTLLLFFVVPINFKAKWIGYFLWWYEIFHCLFYELTHLSQVASSAHLGGMIAGVVFFKWHQHEEQRITQQSNDKRQPFKGRYHVYIGEDKDKDSTHEMNATKNIFALLKKIHEKGIGSLSAEERKVFERYRDSI